MNTVRKSDEYQVGLVLKGLDELIRELSTWYPKSEPNDPMSRDLDVMVSEKLNLGTGTNQSIIDESIANEKLKRDSSYTDRVQHLRSIRNVFEDSRSLKDVPESIRRMAQKIFNGVIVRKVAMTFPSPIRPHAIDTAEAQVNIASIYHYTGALIVLRPPEEPLSMTYPFDF
jgi:hypothetical protein